uniref:Potassium channel domain-containing protein n=1 Tax=Megaselia scalaris TaxID=36166 RepID=T1GCS7_MEGSC
LIEKLNVLYEKNWTTLVHEQLRRFEGSIVAATRNSHNTDSSNVHNGVMMLSAADNGLDNGRWSFSEALLYSISVITTIGHGNFTPKTSSGKIATILYALVGVPLMLICLSSLGGLLADALQCTYSRLCCTPSKSGEIVAGTGTGKAMAATTTTVSMQMTKIKPNNGNEISAATN